MIAANDQVEGRKLLSGRGTIIMSIFCTEFLDNVWYQSNHPSSCSDQEEFINMSFIHLCCLMLSARTWHISGNVS